MGPGPIGTSGVLAASRAAQDKRFAVANVHFLLVVVEDPVRVLQKIEKAATSRAVSFAQLRFSVKQKRVSSLQAILSMDPGPVGPHGVIAASPVAWGRGFGTKVAHTFPIVMDDHVTEQDKTKLAVIRPAVSLENGALHFVIDGCSICLTFV